MQCIVDNHIIYLFNKILIEHFFHGYLVAPVLCDDYV